MMTVTLRIDVPESMSPTEVCDMLEDMTADLYCMDIESAPDERAEASGADWTDADGAAHHWNS